MQLKLMELPMIKNILFMRLTGWLHSVGAIINAILAIILIMFVSLTLYSGHLMTHINQINNQINDGYYSVGKLKDAATECDKSINEYLRNGNRTNLSDFNDSALIFRNILLDLEKTQRDSETLYLLRSINDSFDTYFITCSLACLKYYSNDYTYYTYMYEAQKINEYINKYCDELLQQVMEEGRNVARTIHEKHSLLSAVNIFAISGSIFLSFIAITYINLRITSPLNQLVVATRKISKGDFDVKVHFHGSQNTIGELIETFNMMARSIKSMMKSMQEKAQTERNLLLEQQKNIEYQQMLSQANFLALQTQINPHFLFNTLNSISRIITLGMYEEAISMIEAMVALLRYNLTDASEPVLLKHELDITQQYLKIQQYRFQNRINVKMDFDPKLVTKVIVPRFVLQPIVENSIVHGLEPMEDGGCIKIKVRKKGESCVIKIIDNGTGICPEILKELLQGNRKSSHITSIGISNTKKRVEIFTGNPESFRLTSRPGIGTVTTVIVPIGKEAINVLSVNRG